MQSADYLICPICSDFFQDVVETPCCSQGYCAKCLDSALQATGGLCPSCRKEVGEWAAPNKMIQRMVDAIPAECQYCSAAHLTRGIVKEHMEKCDQRPGRSSCFLHGKPLNTICPQDGVEICEMCALVGRHRHHFPSVTVSMDNVNSSIVALDSDGRIVLSQEEAMDAITYAAIICKEGGLDVTPDAIITVLAAAGVTAEKEQVELVAKLSGKFEDLSQVVLYSSPRKQQQEVLDGPEYNEKEFQNEYEKLKDVYHKTQFNFEGVQIKAVPICDYLLPKAKNTVFALVEIRVGKQKENSTEKKRPPFALSLVLDVSGSMAGGKLNCALDAVNKVIDSLEPGDTVHLIQYNHEASVVFENGNHLQANQLKVMVNSLSANGGTNIEVGLNLGFKILQNNTKKDQDVLKRIFLFSDGSAGSGFTTCEQLSNLVSGYTESEVRTSAFGIGSDFVEKVMKGIADGGRGNYFFIDSPQSTEQMLLKAFHGLSRTVASNVMLKLKGRKGTKVTKLNSTEGLLKGMELGDMRYKDLKQVMVQMEVDCDEEDATSAAVDVLEFELSYDRKDEYIPASPMRGAMSMKATTELSKLNQLNDEVLVYLRIHECGELDGRILKLMDAGNMEDAIEVKRKVVKILQDITEKDKIGFARVLCMRARGRLQEMQQARHSRGGNASALRKAIHKDVEEEEDEDMGFGLFD